MKKIILTSLVGVFAVSAAHAVIASPYISVKGAYSNPYIAARGDSLNLSSLGITGVSSATESVDVRVNVDGVLSLLPAIGAKIEFEQFSLATFRAEVEYSLNQNAKRQAYVPGLAYLDGKAKAWAVMANFYMDFYTGEPVRPFITAGIGYGNVAITGDATLMEEDTYSSEWKRGNFAWAVGGGFTFEITQSANIDLQYRYIDYGKVSADDIVDVKYAAHQFMLGARYTF